MTRSVLLTAILSGLAAAGFALSGLSGTARAQDMPHPHVPGMSPQGSGMVTPPPSDPMDAHSYVVEKGDTLSGIAKQLLGDEGRWMQIARANRIDDPSKLAVGTRLEIPAASREQARGGDAMSASEGHEQAAPRSGAVRP
jgi:nucleoid-associated protein YgaU